MNTRLFTRPAQPYEVAEKSIDELQQALTAGEVTSRQLVESYFARIKAYDQSGPKLNSVVVLNPKALEQADALDVERASGTVRGPLHGIPVLVKDNFETIGMPTSAGSIALATYQSSTDAFQVKRLKAAGAIIIVKTTMHELAAWYTTIGSLTGITRNPYDPTRTPGGSSGGTGAAIAASFAAAGLGTDTCGSIRLPAAYQNLVGMRGTRGLSSRDGIVPSSSTQDMGGPMTRSVADLALLLDATVGADPNDVATEASKEHIPRSYREALVPNGLKGSRIGVVRSLFGAAPEDLDYGAVVDGALKQMERHGAELVDVNIPGLDELLTGASVNPFEFRWGLDAFLAKRPSAPVKSYMEFFTRGLVHDQLMTPARLSIPDKRDEEGYRRAFVKQKAILAVVIAVIEEHRLDALAYPTSTRPPNLIDMERSGDEGACKNLLVSPATGLPAMSVPVGFGIQGTPVGMELLGNAFSELSLLKIAYGWEQVAHPRMPPFSTPPLLNCHAPAAVTATVTVLAQGGARVEFTYDQLTSTLHYRATSQATDLIALTIQRGTSEAAGGIVASLLLQGRQCGRGEVLLRSKDRNDLAFGRLFVHLYTRSAPLGAGRSPIQLSPNVAHKSGV
ncbi:hypothetical protein XI07_05580 [Bradyrhizobium sp. CCBAU 11445]|uniref:amidase n=1 Tax=Bradyrhizobium sp. CCBAU 11445 TaxID=1630896 RepID=UPI002306A458|nr:amidase family protein [Bradyrhizobium sp. CCBAU 11445]MDA9481482.1 hypothetical protein [Bradyrhizobium sp. CCBAU 11445]